MNHPAPPPADVCYTIDASHPRRIMVASDLDAALRDVSSVWTEAAGVRVFACSISDALNALDLQAAPDVLIVEIERCNDAACALLDRCEALAVADGQRGIIIFPRDALGTVAARIAAPSLSLLCDPSPVERVAAIGFAVERGVTGVLETRDIAPEGLQSLADEVARIARALAALASAPAASSGDIFSDGLIGYRAEPLPRAVSTVPVSAGEVRAMIRARRLRERFFLADLFADPAWDMLLDLFAARIERTQVAVSSLCIAAAVPPTTALRTIRAMTATGLLTRVDDPGDRRRVFIALSEATATAMQNYVAAAREVN